MERVKPVKQVNNNRDMVNKINTAKSKTAIHLCNMFLSSFPSQVLHLSHLKVVNMGHNNIENIPESISGLKGLTHLYVNNNPVQFIPVSLTDCRYLQVVDASHTYIKILPFEVCHLKQLYDINLTGCPLVEPLSRIYQKGTFYVLKYYQDKMEREKYRDKIVNTCKEDIWIDSSLEEIHERVGQILDNVEGDDISLLKRLLRNLKYMVPQTISDCDPFTVRQNLMTSRGTAKNIDQYDKSAVSFTQNTIHQSGSHFQDKSMPMNDTIHVEDNRPSSLRA